MVEGLVALPSDSKSIKDFTHKRVEDYWSMIYPWQDKNKKKIRGKFTVKEEIKQKISKNLCWEKSICNFSV